MIKLIINSDDFGYSEGVNLGIIRAHKDGIVNSATTMMNMPGAEQALSLAKAYPNLKLGIHLVLTCGKPLVKDVPSLMDKKGGFKNLTEITSDPSKINLTELEREWEAQMEKFLALGGNPTHFDSHHHTHTIKEFLPVVQKLAKKYNLPVRRANDAPIEGVKAFSDEFLTDFYAENVTYDYFEKLKERVKDESVVEIMTHPAYLDAEVLTGSSYTIDRVKELDVLTSVKLPDGMKLI